MNRQDTLDRFMNPTTRQALMDELEEELEATLACTRAGRRDPDHIERVTAIIENVALVKAAMALPTFQHLPT